MIYVDRIFINIDHFGQNHVKILKHAHISSNIKSLLQQPLKAKPHQVQLLNCSFLPSVSISFFNKKGAGSLLC